MYISKNLTHCKFCCTYFVRISFLSYKRKNSFREVILQQMITILTTSETNAIRLITCGLKLQKKIFTNLWLFELEKKILRWKVFRTKAATGRYWKTFKYFSKEPSALITEINLKEKDCLWKWSKFCKLHEFLILKCQVFVHPQFRTYLENSGRVKSGKHFLNIF